MPRQKQQRNVARARALRKAMSLPEVLLWQRLRAFEHVRIRRQHPIGPYVLDFFCPAARLCIEIDGVAHDMGDHPIRDAQRDAWLTSQGIAVERVGAAKVLADADGVAEAIARLCES